MFITSQYSFAHTPFTLKLRLMEWTLSGTLPVSWLRKRRNGKPYTGSKSNCLEMTPATSAYISLARGNLKDWLDISGIGKYNPSLGYKYSRTIIQFPTCVIVLLSGYMLLKCLTGYIFFSFRIYVPLHRDKKLQGLWIGLSFWLVDWPPSSSLGHVSSICPSHPMWFGSTRNQSIVDLGFVLGAALGQDWHA